MNKTLNTILLVLLIVVLAGGIFYAGTIYARSTMMFRWGNNPYGPGMMNSMMGGNGGMTLAPDANAGVNLYGYNNSDLTPLTINQAQGAAETYIQSLATSGLEVGEVMIFDINAYVVIEETETGLGAFELLVDPVTKNAYPEHGPNMMWNLKYNGLNHQNMTLAPGASVGVGKGMMGGNIGMMNGWNSTTPSDISGEMTITPEQAMEYAQAYLDANIAGATPAEDPIQFYGYYTLDYEKDGKVAGMLSVNGFSGQVFLHTWHGTFIEEME
jgi:hypothetical protein